MRSAFGLTSVVFFMYFVTITIRCQNWTKWHTTQKWLPVFLFLQIFYHDPIFGLQAVVGGEGWAIYHATASLAFIFSFLFYLLIFVHGLFVVREIFGNFNTLSLLKKDSFGNFTFSKSFWLF
jgi:hypothetical protein